jgi:hypothetical protein
MKATSISRNFLLRSKKNNANAGRFLFGRSPKKNAIQTRLTKQTSKHSDKTYCGLQRTLPFAGDGGMGEGAKPLPP